MKCSNKESCFSVDKSLLYFYSGLFYFISMVGTFFWKHGRKRRPPVIAEDKNKLQSLKKINVSTNQGKIHEMSSSVTFETDHCLFNISRVTGTK